jgi:hypothetical protein
VLEALDGCDPRGKFCQDMVPSPLFSVGGDSKTVVDVSLILIMMTKGMRFAPTARMSQLQG